MADSGSADPNHPTERRSVERHPPADSPTFVWISLDQRIRARVTDESSSGIGMIVPEQHLSLFEAGFEVRIQREESRRTAIIAFKTDPQDGEFRVGLKWVRS